MPKHHIKFLIHPFNTPEEFYQALRESRLLSAAPGPIAEGIINSVRSAYDTVAAEFPDGVEKTMGAALALLRVGDKLEPGVQMVAKNSFLTTMAAYAEAARDARALATGLHEITEALKKVPREIWESHPGLMEFLVSYRESAAKMESIVADKPCTCPNCAPKAAKNIPGRDRHANQ